LVEESIADILELQRDHRGSE